MYKFCFVVVFFLSYRAFSQNWEYNLIADLQRSRTTSSDKFWNGLSQSSDYTAIGTPLILLTTGFATKDSKLKQDGVASAIAILGTYGAGYLLKKGIDRERPFEKYPEFTPFIYKTSGSMPSGSTATAFTTATTLTLMKPKWYVAIPAYGYAVSVGFSRIRLAEHYPTDVIAGAALGTASSLISKKLTQWINK
jgi:membrane-associated phospholipid phosphatase